MPDRDPVVKRARPADVGPLSATLARAFAADPMILWPMPEATADQLRELFTLIMTPYVEFGAAWMSRDHAAAAAWLPPDLAGRFGEIDEATRPAINSLTSDGGRRYAEFWDWLDTHLPPSCWFLDVLGVRPEAQGRGLGRALVRHGLELARADGRPAFLETGQESNVAFYESLGFAVVDRQRAPGGGPVIWFMQASPHAPSS
jgi:GNAT superfamily N-acetyltransferase